MIHEKHNLYHNYFSAGGDEKDRQDILLSEITKIIKKHPVELRFYLNEYNIDYLKKGSDKEIVDSVASNIKTNKKFREKIVSLIMRINSDYKLDADGEQNYQIEKEIKQELSSKIKFLFEGENNNNQTKLEDKVDLFDGKTRIDKAILYKRLFWATVAIGVSIWAYNRYFARPDVNTVQSQPQGTFNNAVSSEGTAPQQVSSNTTGSQTSSL